MLRYETQRTSHVIRRAVASCAAAALCLSVALAERVGLTEELINYVEARYGKQARQTLLEWQAMVEEARSKSEQEKLKLVNLFFNKRIKFVDDIEHWGKRDYWATPVETMATRGGDCEDFTIAKYFTLRALGVPDERMRLTYVRAKRLNQAHMVLTYFPSPQAEPLVLDNLIDAIKPASQRPDLVPVYSFNGVGLWRAKERGRGRLIGKSSSFPLWTDLESRLRREGFKQ